MRIFKLLVLFGIMIVTAGCEDCDNYSPAGPTSVAESGKATNPISQAQEALADLTASSSLVKINGIELMTVSGWFANIYPWSYDPGKSAVHPVPSLWTANQFQNSEQIRLQNQQLEEYGSGADILEFNVAPGNPDYNHWMVNYFSNGSRPFFILYEHIFGNANYVESDGPKNMSLPQNRQAFMDDMDFIIHKIVIPNQGRYITVEGRAVIYLWSSIQMKGDFASVLNQARAKYPIFFIGSEGMQGLPSAHDDVARVRALDGFMDYSLGGPSNYLLQIQRHHKGAYAWRNYIRKLESETGKRYLLIPTFQAAYDDTKFPGRGNPPMYPRSKEEVEYHAQLIKSGQGNVFDPIGPFVVYNELPEGAAVIESQCTSETENRDGRYTGCGTGRLEILRNFFGK